MTSPFSDRLRMAASATGGSRPEMAVTMANSDLGDGDMQLVGGFAKALDDAALVRISRIGGQRLELDSDQRSRLDAVGEDYSDVNESEDDDSRNWLERVVEGIANKVSNTGKYLFNNPVSDVVLGGFTFLNDVAHLPARMISSGIDQGNDDEVVDAMTAKGYDPESAWDRIQFFTMQGDSLYHDLDGIRGTHDSDLVDLALEQNADPEGFAERVAKLDPKLQEKVNSDEFAKVSDLVNRQHVSPGRDIARILTGGNVDSAAFTAISGVLDATYTIMLDPTLLVGKVARGARALDALGNATSDVGRLSKLTGVPALVRGADKLTKGKYRSGLRDALDQDGIRALLDEKHIVGQRAQAFLDDAAKLRNATDDAERASIYARMQAVHKPWMPYLDEVGGTRVLEQKYTDVDLVRRLRQDLQDSKGVNEAVFPAATPEDVETVDGWLRITAKTKLKEAPEQRARMLGLLENEAALGRKLEVDQAVIADTTRGSRQRFEAAVREALGARRELPDVPTMPVAEGATFDRKLVDTQGIGWMATKGKEITTLEDFREYLASTAGFLRMAHGAAAKREIVLPGRISLSARALGALGARRAAQGGLIFDHTKPYQFMPNEVEEGIQSALDDGTLTAGDVMYNMRTRGTADGEGYNPIRKARAKWEQRARRVSSLVPTVSRIDLTSAQGTEQVRRLARLYINKAEADRLASLYAVSDLGRRREIVAGVNEQIFHAAGLSRSEEGMAQIEKFRADQLGLNKRAYGLNRTDVIKTEAGERHVALLPSQLSDEVLIPDFKSLQYLASKYVVAGWLGRTAGTIRAGINSDVMDQVSHSVKIGWITSSAGGTRNALDEVAGASLTGGGLQMLRARALFSEATKKARGDSLAAKKRAARLEGRMRWSIPRALRGMSNSVNDVLMANQLGKLMSFKKDADLVLDDAKYAGEVAEDVQAGVVSEALTGTFFADDTARLLGNDGAVEAAADGIVSAPVRFSGENVRHEFDGWRQVEVDGGVGLDGFVNNLGMHFQDLTSPAHVALRGLTTDGADVLSDVVEYMQTPIMRHFRENAEAFKWTRDGKPVVTADDELEAIEHYSQRLIANVVMLVSGRGKQIGEADELAGAAARWENDVLGLDYKGPGPINVELLEMLKKGDIPDRAWVKENLAPEELPLHVVQKTWRPINPQHAPGQLAQGYTSLLTKAYKKVVTDQVNAISRNPMYTAAYAQARHNIKPYEQHLIDNGFDADIAEKMARRMSRRQAEESVIRMVDNPTQSTQYAIIARNFHAFARAQEDWLRRWGRIIKDDPTVIRKAQLAIHGGESAGLVEKNDQGDLIFTYPGSGMVINAFNKVLGGLKIGGVQVPMMPDLTSQLIFLNPSLDNPVGFSSMPVISIPFKAMAASLGADYPLLTASMDKILNGELGAGREWYEMMLPGFANRIISGVLSDEDPQSQFASAYTSALMNLSAAGRLDELDFNDETAVARFQNDLKNQITNQMVARSLFGFFAPAAPSMPTNDVQTEDGDWVLKPDFTFHKIGISTLKDEARFIFSKMPYEQALEYWTKNHPGELIYAQGEVARTTVGTEDAQAFATIDAAKWMQDNPYLLDSYGGKGGVAAYFIPQGTAGTTGGQFSQVAYRAQLEQGIREHKTLDQFFEDIVIQRGEAIYYDSRDDYREAINRAVANGNTAQADQLEAEWAQQAQLIKDSNPLMAKKFAAFATSGVGRRQQLYQLNKMLADPEAVHALGDQSAGVAQLMLAEREFEAGRQAVSGKRGPQATAQRENNAKQYEATVAAIVAQYPGLGDLARGIFRVPN